MTHFFENITKKHFGDYITPEQSPVPDERFKGYHTAVDVEFPIADEIIVQAIDDGTVLMSKWTQGYGGLVVIEHHLDGKRVLGIYGHLDPGRMVPKGVTVEKGQFVGLLGDDMTQETDFERKHLHFGLYKGDGISTYGYVSNEDMLEDWLDPEEVLRR